MAKGEHNTYEAKFPKRERLPEAGEFALPYWAVTANYVPITDSGNQGRHDERRGRGAGGRSGPEGGGSPPAASAPSAHPTEPGGPSCNG